MKLFSIVVIGIKTSYVLEMLENKGFVIVSNHYETIYAQSDVYSADCIYEFLQKLDSRETCLVSEVMPILR